MEAEGRDEAASRSKRNLIQSLPDGWLEELWDAAVARRSKHLTAIGVLIVTGCRPAEVCHGVAVRLAGEDVEVAIAGAKVRNGHGQPFRLLRVRAEGRAACHLADLAAAAPGGVARVRASCSPDALSAAIANLAGERWGRRCSAYDVRHARAAAVRLAFNGDLEACSRWLGHHSLSTQRFYARLPRTSRLQGPRPVSADAPLPVRRRGRTRAPEPITAPAF